MKRLFLGAVWAGVLRSGTLMRAGVHGAWRAGAAAFCLASVVAAAAGNCEALTGSYEAHGEYEKSGVRYPKGIFDSLNRPGPRHVESFIVELAENDALRFVFRASNGDPIQHLTLSDGSCSLNGWERQYEYDGSADGTRVMGVRRYRFNRVGQYFEVHFAETDPRNGSTFVATSWFRAAR